MRMFVAVLMAGFLLLLLALQWRTHYEAAASPASQIYIHDTPVCVMLEGEQLVARVGECPRERSGLEAPGPERLPFHGAPDGRLPPGHPPIDRHGPPDENRRIPI